MDETDNLTGCPDLSTSLVNKTKQKKEKKKKKKKSVLISIPSWQALAKDMGREIVRGPSVVRKGLRRNGDMPFCDVLKCSGSSDCCCDLCTTDATSARTRKHKHIERYNVDPCLMESTRLDLLV